MSQRKRAKGVNRRHHPSKMLQKRRNWISFVGIISALILFFITVIGLTDSSSSVPSSAVHTTFAPIASPTAVVLTGVEKLIYDYSDGRAELPLDYESITIGKGQFYLVNLNRGMKRSEVFDPQAVKVWGEFLIQSAPEVEKLTGYKIEVREGFSHIFYFSPQRLNPNLTTLQQGATHVAPESKQTVTMVWTRSPADWDHLTAKVEICQSILSLVEPAGGNKIPQEEVCNNLGFFDDLARQDKSLECPPGGFKSYEDSSQKAECLSKLTQLPYPAKEIYKSR